MDQQDNLALQVSRGQRDLPDQREHQANLLQLMWPAMLTLLTPVSPALSLRRSGSGVMERRRGMTSAGCLLVLRLTALWVSLNNA